MLCKWFDSRDTQRCYAENILETMRVWNLWEPLALLFATGKDELLEIRIAAKRVEILISLRADAQTWL